MDLPETVLFRNARILTMREDLPELIAAGAILAREGRIAWIGPEGQAPAGAAETVDLGGRLVTPGLIDCHTHLVHAGDRAAEFERRLEGATYEEIARAGGGILSTVRATRAADEASLVASALPRLDALLTEGVTTIEIKSGYGLEEAAELRMLSAARTLAAKRSVRVRTAYLGAHAIPPDRDRDDYLREMRERTLPLVASERLADAVDAFCERIAYTPAEVAGLFETATALGLRVKLHADQLSNLHGGALAARFRALSADHLEYCDADGAAAMAASGTVAVLLPGATYFLSEEARPPIDLFRRSGTRMAIATDCNPGSSPLTSLLLAMNMAATLFRMTVAECLAGVTREAAHALGLQDEAGMLAPGLACDLAVWDVARPAELVYRIGFNPLHRRIVAGRISSCDPLK
jgi:imidazolonepropionase